MTQALLLKVFSWENSSLPKQFTVPLSRHLKIGPRLQPLWESRTWIRPSLKIQMDFPWTIALSCVSYCFTSLPSPSLFKLPSHLCKTEAEHSSHWTFLPITALLIKICPHHFNLYQAWFTFDMIKQKKHAFDGMLRMEIHDIKCEMFFLNHPNWALRLRHNTCLI